jgi:hypothetical protein
MNMHFRAAPRGHYYFASIHAPDGSITVWLVAWLGWPLTWATVGYVGPNEHHSLLMQRLNPVEVLIDNLLV